jgi:hypothetical protein
MHFWPLNKVKIYRSEKAEREGLFPHSDHSIEIRRAVNYANSSYIISPNYTIYKFLKGMFISELRFSILKNHHSLELVIQVQGHFYPR